MNKCAVCRTQTDKCCSLCNKVFYCSPEHQEVDWHINHKFNCEGKLRSFTSNQEEFKIYAQSQQHHESHQTRSYQEEAKVFIQLFQSRLSVRSEILTKYTEAKQSNSPPILLKELAKSGEDLVELSKRVTQTYKSGLGDYLDQTYGLITNSFIIKTDQFLDKVLLARIYQLCFMTRQLKQTLVLLASEIQPFPENLGEQFKKTYTNLLWAIIDISQNASLDKISQKMFAYFIKLCEKFEGAWEQIYAYFNMGVWYVEKTYYQKAIKCFNYAVQQATKNNINSSSGLLVADATYNIAICQYSLKESATAIETMEEAYRLRSQCLGKSSLEASEALLILAKWNLSQRKYQKCLQYVMQCLRIRKLNPSFTRQLEEVNGLIVQIYSKIKQEKDDNEKKGTPNNSRYYDGLLGSKQSLEKDKQERKEPFSKRLYQAVDDVVAFKLIVTPELADTFSSDQWTKMGELIDLQDTKMAKEEAVRILLESAFFNSLDEKQQKEFLQLNKTR